MPKGKLARVGVWEDGAFVGVVLFGYGATPSLAKWCGLPQNEFSELVRVALTEHAAPTSRVVARAVRLLRKAMPGIRCLVSFADTRQHHLGTIYQAMGWVYTGESKQEWFRVNGREVHPRTLGSRYGVGGQSIPWLRQHVDPNAARVDAGTRLRYVLPLDDEMRARIEPLREPYPKRAPSGSPGEQVHCSGRGSTDHGAPNTFGSVAHAQTPEA